MTLRAFALSLTLGLAAASPATAQEAGPDWDFGRDDRRGLVAAAISYDSGIGIAARCMRGSFELLLTGLPKAPSGQMFRMLEVAFQDEEFRNSSWNVSDDRTGVFSQLPAPFARRLREGGRLQIRVPGIEGQPGRRYVLDLPVSPTAIEATLNACGRPLQNPHDREQDGVVGESLGSYRLQWERAPRPEFPRPAGVVWATVALSCVVLDDEGRVGDCIIESEHPTGYGFGNAAVRSVRRARIGAAEDSPPGMQLTGRRLTFSLLTRPN